VELQQVKIEATVTNLCTPVPTIPSNVISMFSDTYTNVAVDTWRTSWSQATLKISTLVATKQKNIVL
jgi:hypothetical protein